MKNEVELTKKHFAFNECYDKNTGNSNIPASRRMLWNKLEQLKEELEVYKSALKFASENALSPYRNHWGDFESQLSKTIEYFLDQAREELESEKD